MSSKNPYWLQVLLVLLAIGFVVLIIAMPQTQKTFCESPLKLCLDLTIHMPDLSSQNIVSALLNLVWYVLNAIFSFILGITWYQLIGIWDDLTQGDFVLLAMRILFVWGEIRLFQYLFDNPPRG